MSQKLQVVPVLRLNLFKCAHNLFFFSSDECRQSQLICKLVFMCHVWIKVLRSFCAFSSHMWYIPSEKIGQNIDPLRNSFFVANYQHWTSTSALEPFLGPLDPWGALGGPWVVWGGLTTQKLPFSFRDQSKPWNGLFWLTITSYTMFLRFWVKMGPSGPKKGCFWPK